MGRAAAALRAISARGFRGNSEPTAQAIRCAARRVSNALCATRWPRVGSLPDEPQIVAVDANAANPHFSTSEGRDTAICFGDLVLIDLFRQNSRQRETQFTAT